MKIKNIIFDLGGVIINLDFQKTFNAFRKLGANDFNYATLQKIFLDHFEIGKINASEFREQLKNEFNLTIADDIFDEAWNAMMLDIPPERLEVIKKLKEHHGYKTFLLSNTNEIHLKAIRQRQDYSQLTNCFHQEYYSNELGFRKPDHNAFIKILQENNLEPTETLFIDDTWENIQSAELLGLQAMHINPHFTILNLIEILIKLKTPK